MAGKSHRNSDNRRGRCLRTCMVLGIIIISLSLLTPIGLEDAHVSADWTADNGRDDGERLLRFDGPGYDRSINMTIPVPSEVLSATLDIEGLGLDIARTGVTYKLTDSGQRAYDWNGSISNPPTGDLASYAVNSWDDQQKAKLDLSDNSGEFNTAGPGFYLTNLYVFDVQEKVSSFNVVWEGHGYNLGAGPQFGATVYVWAPMSTHWQDVGSYQAPVAGDHIISASSLGPSLVDNGTIRLLILPPAGPGDNGLFADEVHIEVTGNLTAFPTDPALDLELGGSTYGAWVVSGQFSTFEPTKINISEGLQMFVDQTGPGETDIQVVLNLSSGSPGFLKVSNISLQVDTPPVLLEQIQDMSFDEDSSVFGAIDLRGHFDDDMGFGNLEFDILAVSNGSFVEAVINDTHIDFLSREMDWNGIASFRTTATDASGFALESNMFNVTVVPKNDPPSISGPSEIIAQQDKKVTTVFSASDPDGDDLDFSDDSPLFDIGPSNGTLTFTPSNDDVGRHTATITVEDPSGASASFTVEIVVENVNDAPVFDPLDGPLQAVQDELFSYTVVATDIDKDPLTFGDNTTLFEISDDGVIVFMPKNSQVGTHRIRITVTDPAGTEAHLDLVLVILNVNDPPQDVSIEVLTVKEELKEGGDLRLRGHGYDKDGDPLTFSWYLDGDEIGSGKDVSIDDMVEGDHTISLTVSDGIISVDASTVVTIMAVEKRPPPVQGPDPTIFYLGFGAAALLVVGTVSATEVGKFRWILIFLPLFTRLKREKVLDHETRGMIKGYIIANPGDHYNSIKKKLGLNNGTLAYHLKVLMREEYVKARNHGVYKRFYPFGMKLPNEDDIPVLDKLTEKQKVVLRVISLNPGINLKELAWLADLKRQTAQKHIKVLEGHGLIKREFRGRETHFFPREDFTHDGDLDGRTV